MTTRFEDITFSDLKKEKGTIRYEHLKLPESQYVRVGLDVKMVEHYSEMLSYGAIFPPILVSRDVEENETNYVCIDGRGRAQAYENRAVLSKNMNGKRDERYDFIPCIFVYLPKGMSKESKIGLLIKLGIEANPPTSRPEGPKDIGHVLRNLINMGMSREMVSKVFPDYPPHFIKRKFDDQMGVTSENFIREAVKEVKNLVNKDMKLSESISITIKNKKYRGRIKEDQLRKAYLGKKKVRNSYSGDISSMFKGFNTSLNSKLNHALELNGTGDQGVTDDEMEKILRTTDSLIDNTTRYQKERWNRFNDMKNKDKKVD